LGTKRAFQSPSQFLFETFSPLINIWLITFEIRAGTRTCVFSDFHQNCILSANLVKPPNIKLHESPFRGSPNKHDYYSCSPSGKHNSCSTKNKTIEDNLCLSEPLERQRRSSSWLASNCKSRWLVDLLMSVYCQCTSIVLFLLPGTYRVVNFQAW